MRDFFIKAFATGFGFGLSPTVPGTTGTIPGVVIAWLLFPLGWIVQATSTLIALSAGVWLATKAEDYYGHDGKPIVIDEIAGMFAAYCFIPVDWRYYLLGFVLFRIGDVIKPFPARRWEDLPRGWGIMADDLVVGVYTNIILQVLLYFQVWR